MDEGAGSCSVPAALDLGPSQEPEVGGNQSIRPNHEACIMNQITRPDRCLSGSESQNRSKGNSSSPQVGDRARIWNYETLWSEHHKTAEQLEPLRQVGDPLADECLRTLGVKPGTDALETLQHYLSKPICEQKSGAPIRKFHEHTLTAPDWIDWNTIKRGQEVYWAHALPITTILIHYSLAGGFSAPKIVKTLSCTNYMSAPTRTFHRLLETHRFVIDCMKGGIQTLQPGTGTGWESVLRVRLLHTQVRLRILALASVRPDCYSTEIYGIPINQEDSVATLCAFSISVIVALEKMGIYLSPNDVLAYLHLWRLVGHYMGVLPENNPLTSREYALLSFESIVTHIVYPDEMSAGMTRAILRAVAGKPPFRLSFAVHSAMARALLGDEFSNALQIESTNWYNRVKVGLIFSTLRWTCSPWWFLRCRIQIAEKYNTMLFQSTEVRQMSLNFNMKMVPQFSEEKDGAT